MSLDSHGCNAVIKNYIKQTENSIIVEAYTCRCVMSKGKRKYIPDFIDRMTLYKKGDLQVYHGDIINIKSFYIKNRMDNCAVNKYYTVIVPDWEIVKRNPFVEKYYKRKKEEEELRTKIEQKMAFEEELESEEQDLDEYIENIDENNPF